MTLPTKHSWRISDSSRLIDVLVKKFSPMYSARALKRALECNGCRVNGRVERFASQLLKKGALVEFTFLAPVKKPLIPSILYEDEELLVVNKSAGHICQNASFQNLLERKIWLSHRLDKETTGVLLFGKTISSVEKLQELFKHREMKKEYLALVDGIPLEAEGERSSYFIKKGSFHGQTIWQSNSCSTGLFAQTAWMLEKRFDAGVSLLRCIPKTGRTHQIRVHLSEMGHPILVDRQYAQKYRSSLPISRTLLHASRLVFEWKGERKMFEAPLPGDFSSALDLAANEFYRPL